MVGQPQEDVASAIAPMVQLATGMKIGRATDWENYFWRERPAMITQIVFRNNSCSYIYIVWNIAQDARDQIKSNIDLRKYRVKLTESRQQPVSNK